MLRCDGCSSYEPWDGGVGRCHFMPPPNARDVRNEMWTPFPLVEPQWWCSQHAPKPDTKTVEPDTKTGLTPDTNLHPPPLPLTPPATAFGGGVVAPEDDF